MTETIGRTAAQALVRYLTAQLTEAGESFIAGVWAVFGHGNVAGLGEALYASHDLLPTWRGHNEQTMAHAAIAYADARNMVTAAAIAHAEPVSPEISGRRKLRDACQADEGSKQTQRAD